MTVYRHEGEWWTRFSLNGHSYRRPTGASRKAAAVEFENKLRAQLYGLHARGQTREMSFGQAIDRYYETVILPKPQKPKGLYRKQPAGNNLLRVKRLEQFFGRDASLEHVSKIGVIAQFNHALLKEMLPQSANRYLSLLRAILNKAYEWGALPYPPIVKGNREPRPINRALTPMDEERLLQVVSERLRDVVIFILDTGARREEALYLTWDHVDLEREPRGVVYFTDTKSGEHRCVPLPRRSHELLVERKRFYGNRSTLVFSHPATRDLYNNRGQLYARAGDMVIISNFQVEWRRVREKLGMPDVRLHDLRHTYATKLVRRGVPLYDVSKLLGHTSLKMTMRYVYLSIDELDRAVAVLDE